MTRAWILEIKTVIWWIIRVLMVVAGIAWLIDGFRVAFGDVELTQLEQTLGAFAIGFALIGGLFGFKKPT